MESDGFLHIESILLEAPVPIAQTVLERPWLWGWGVTVTKTGQINLIMRLGRSGSLVPVRIPLITRYAIRWPLSFLHKLPASFNPSNYDPRWMPS